MELLTVLCDANGWFWDEILVKSDGGRDDSRIDYIEGNEGFKVVYWFRGFGGQK
ncbi:Hypothetical predicted protein, partial [Olea europaea subsp. europaea]